MKKTITAACLASLAAVAVGCSSGDSTKGPEATLEAPFVIVERKGEEEGIRVRSGGQKNESFYIAIRRSELDKRWFLSAFMKQFHPRRRGLRRGALARHARRVLQDPERQALRLRRR